MITKGMHGEPMPIFESLTRESVSFQCISCTANCDVCGTKNIATMTARVTPVGATWVGGKEAYKSCCPPCFRKECIYTNPLKLLANPTFYIEESEEILKSTGLLETTFCKATAAAILALENG